VDLPLPVAPQMRKVLLLGVADVAGKYYIPKLGGFIVYSLMIAILIWRPQGLFVRQGGKS